MIQITDLNIFVNLKLEIVFGSDYKGTICIINNFSVSLFRLIKQI